MESHRHPHPHIDPRQPRDGAQPGTNPPVFAWKPLEDSGPYQLTVARDAELSDVVLRVEGLKDPLHLPEQAFAPGSYFWEWSAGAQRSQRFIFSITPEAVVLEVPPAAEWLRRLPAGHPRIYLRPDDLPELRASRHGARFDAWLELQTAAEALLTESHRIEEPPYLADRNLDYEAFFRVWSAVMWGSRRFVMGAETLGLAWLVSGDPRYARAACRRMASISRWNPEGSSDIDHNDEAHMSVIWHGANACDWVFDQFTDDERELVIEQFRRRGQLTFEHMHGRGSYGVTRFDSHAGREIVFLAHIAMVFSDHIPEAVTWLEWLRPVLCGIWPVWAGDDGAWAEGISYGLAYVNIMTMFASALKRGVGVDLYRRPFWLNHARWRQAFQPPYAEWIGFGDHTERWRGSWLEAAGLVELIGRETATPEFEPYVAAMRAEAESMTTPAARQGHHVSAQRFLAPPAAGEPPAGEAAKLLKVFPTAGWAAIRTAPDNPAEDIAFLFRSSPFGAISHSHANNNDFILHVGGKVLAMPSGYYNGYASNHHAHWVWHTKSHNCVTLSDGSQILRSHDSRGAVEVPFEDEALAYFRGTADASYREAERCRRHVAWLKEQRCFVLVDELLTAPGATVSLQWNLHSWSEFEVDETARGFRLVRDGSGVDGHLLWQANGFFSLTHGWDPPPGKRNEQWRMQHHLRFTCGGMARRVHLGVVLQPFHAGLTPAPLVAERADGLETARIGQHRVVIGGEAHLTLELGKTRYQVTDQGVEVAPAVRT